MFFGLCSSVGQLRDLQLSDAELCYLLVKQHLPKLYIHKLRRFGSQLCNLRNCDDRLQKMLVYKRLFGMPEHFIHSHQFSLPAVQHANARLSDLQFVLNVHYLRHGRLLPEDRKQVCLHQWLHADWPHLQFLLLANDRMRGLLKRVGVHELRHASKLPSQWSQRLPVQGRLHSRWHRLLNLQFPHARMLCMHLSQYLHHL